MNEDYYLSTFLLVIPTKNHHFLLSANPLVTYPSSFPPPAGFSMPSFGGGGDLKDDLQLSESDEDSDEL